MFKTRTAVFYQVQKFEDVAPEFLDLIYKTRAVSVLNSFKNDPLLVVLAFSLNC